MEKEYLNNSKNEPLKRMLFEEAYINEVLNILDECAMYQEKETFSKLLSRIEGKYELVHTQGKCFNNLENEIQKLEDPMIKKSLNDMLNETREEYKDIKNKFDDLKAMIIEKSRILAETFKTSGQAAFHEAFKEICSVLKSSH